MSIVATLLVACALVFIAACTPQETAPPSVSSESLSQRTPRPTFTALANTPSPSAAETGSTPSAGVDPAQPSTEPSATPEAPSTPIVKPMQMASPEYGMQAFLWWRPEVASRDLQVISDAGFVWVKVNFGWREIELEKGGYDWSHTDSIVSMANAEGLDIIARIDYQPEWAGGGYPTSGPPDDPQDLADFLSALATRYAGRIRAYQIWNEPNLGREWGGQTPDPGAYVKLLKLAYDAVKAADPHAMVISAGMSPTGTWDEQTRPDDWYVESMYIAMGGSSEGYFDVLGAHGAGYLSPPETDPATVEADPALGGHRSMAFRRVEDLRAIMVKYGDENKQIALLEFGWTSDPRPESPYHWHAVSEETKAEYLVRAYQYARDKWSPWIGVMSLIYVADPDWTPDNEQYWWAITEPGYPTFVPRPAYLALQAMAK
ncbi:MAG: cellulase family glycosylhydrolase [Chloroflexi bacterium]|nr:cellulase family glycosylhydrolase [Chloroflexota bacterium]